jgi:hypothetical protein
MDDELPREVLRSIDTLLEEQPDKIGHDFSDATRRLSAWRDMLAQRWRETRGEADRRNLERVNAALSVVLGGQFPVGEVPWGHVRNARQDLAQLITGH